MNDIIDIKPLENFNFDNLEKLDLSGNKNLNDIQRFEKIKLKKIKEINLGNTDISDIKSLRKLRLEKLNISRTKISDIKILEDENFKYLKELIFQELITFIQHYMINIF